MVFKDSRHFLWKILDSDFWHIRFSDFFQTDCEYRKQYKLNNIFNYSSKKKRAPKYFASFLSRYDMFHALCLLVFPKTLWSVNLNSGCLVLGSQIFAEISFVFMDLFSVEIASFKTRESTWTWLNELILKNNCRFVQWIEGLDFMKFLFEWKKIQSNSIKDFNFRHRTFFSFDSWLVFALLEGYWGLKSIHSVDIWPKDGWYAVEQKLTSFHSEICCQCQCRVGRKWKNCIISRRPD